MLAPKEVSDRAGDGARETRFELGDEVFRRLVDSAQDHAIFLLAPSGVISTWNTGAQRINGYSAAEAIGRHFSIFYTADALERGWPDEELRRAQAEGRLEDEGWRVRKDGSRFWANVVISPLYGDNGELLGYSKITRDLTQRMRIEGLEQRGRRVSDFLAMLSHELRTPLGTIQQAAAILQMDPNKADWCAAIIDRQIRQLRRLVDDLLDVSRISTGKIQFQRSAVDFNRLVQEAVEMSRAGIEGHRHALTLSIAAEPAPVFGDPARLTQVVVNLLNNASKYTPDGGQIAVSTQRDDTRITLQVSDNGMGMDEGLVQHAFDPYVQGERASTRAEGGLGIGLTLVKSIVEFHGGSVVASSAGEDKGTTMTVALPLQRA
jgi:PAS domain S-box-containing protein